jgi:hypothetical protein
MARLRLMHPGNHRSAERIGDDLENIVRYLNASEFGDKTLAELLDQIFDANGDVDGIVEIRLDPTSGLQYRSGTYTNETDGWSDIVSAADIRGASGVDFGLIDAPSIYGRQDFTADGVTGTYDYAHDSTDDLLVYVNGVLQAESAITNSVSSGTVTVTSTPSASDVVSIYRVRTNNISTYRRSDITSAASQAVFPFVHTDDEVLQVYRNGLLQQSGGANDYTTSAASDTVTFTSSLSSGELVTIITVEANLQTKVLGLMTESNYTNDDGYIPYGKLAIADADIPQAKVSGLAAAMAGVVSTTVSASAPASPSSGDAWIDTSNNPPVLKFYDGTGWYNASPNIQIPTFTSSNALQLLRVNAVGTGLEWATFDTSSLVPSNSVGAANGVASLDNGGKIPISQIPSTYAVDSIFHQQSGSISNATYTMRRIFKQTMRIDGLAVKLSSGSCSVQLTVDGSPVGDIIPVTSTVNDHTLTSSVSIDASSASKTIGVVVTSASSASDLDVTFAVAAENA